jgi:hypothetical protein
VVRLHRYLEFFGKLATAVWVGFVVSLVAGFDWKEVVEQAVNFGQADRGRVRPGHPRADAQEHEQRPRRNRDLHALRRRPSHASAR